MKDHRLRIVNCAGVDPDENLLIAGEAAACLQALSASAGHKDRLLGHVKLAYLDPPFNSGRNLEHYGDNVDSFIWNTHLDAALTAVRKFLAEDGSLWLHLNDAEQHRARLLLDDVFGSENFVATVIWERNNLPRIGGKPFAVRHDYLHVYRKSDSFRMTRPTGRPIDAIWRFTDVGSTIDSSGESKVLFGKQFATPKPERLLARIIELSTAPGDLVLDCYAGSGTTAAVAHKLGRRWLAIEVNHETVEFFTGPRLRQVIDGSDRGGVSNEISWTGGGGFTQLILD